MTGASGVPGQERRPRPEGVRLGIDIGGTFTDLLAFDERTGRTVALKMASTPAPEDAILAGLEVLAERHDVAPADIVFFSHGTTLAVNTLLQRNGDRVGMLVTRGFRDTLELRRLRLPKSNDLFVPKPVSLVPRRHVREIGERVLSDGRVLDPIDLAEVEREARALYGEGIRNIAICFLHSFRNSEHERLAKARIEERLGDVYVCTSSDIWPQQREYERFLVSVINAYVGARMKRYFAALGEGLQRSGVRARVFSTKSNGGVMTLEAAAARPVETLLSGPASGVIGAAHIARLIGERRAVTLDMGGTSVDVSVIDGDVAYATENTVGDFPVIMPAVDVSAIGAGGGSVAWLDAEDVLKVGPRSAGAVPGPACYGRGGREPTVTDAYVVAGLCSPEAFLGGEMKVDGGLAENAVGALAARLGLGLLETADAILQITTANIYAGLVPQIARRGLEASDCTLIPYGAAGPTHSFMVARELAFRRIVVPAMPGLLCALGCLVADLKADFVLTVSRDLSEISADELAGLYGTLEAQARDWLAAQDLDLDVVHLIRSADLCYVGQSFELNTILTEDGPIHPSEVAHRFHKRHRSVYGHADETAPVRVLEARVQIVGLLPKPQVTLAGSGSGAVADLGRRTLYERGRRVEARVLARGGLRTGDRFDGPAIVQQYDTTVYVPEGFRVEVDEALNLVGERIS